MTEPDSTLANAAALLGGITEQLGHQLVHVRPYTRRPQKNEQEVPVPKKPQAPTGPGTAPVPAERARSEPRSTGPATAPARAERARSEPGPTGPATAPVPAERARSEPRSTGPATAPARAERARSEP
ncbi:hypothetical protein ACFVDR_17550, partial [Streptomyces sp. NPDC057695]